MDMRQVDLAMFSAEQRADLYAQVVRRARIEQAKVMRESIAWLVLGAIGVVGTVRKLCEGCRRLAHCWL